MVTLSLIENTQFQSVQVLDVTGRVVHSSNSTTLDLVHLPSGMYTVVTHTDRGKAVSKLVLQ